MRSLSASVTSTYRRRGTWENVILPAAAAIVEGYDTPVTLRQLFYRLVVERLLRNTQSEYNQLSSRTVQNGTTFDTLSDTGPTQIAWQQAVCAYLAAE
jgi:hypothetical protein